MEECSLIIGMPAGSLANPKRGGNLVKFLEDSGFPTRGYETGGPTSFSTVSFLYGWDGRPQEFGTQIALEELDAAIAGDDWIEERRIELLTEYSISIELKKTLPLRRGNVKLVGIVDGKVEEKNTEDFLASLLKKKELITVVSELPYSALDWLRKKLRILGRDDLADSWSVQKYKTPSKVEKGIIVYETWGKTEAKISSMGADIGFEITQSGSALKNYNLKIIENVFNSETSIWVNPKIFETPAKRELLEMFIINLYGTLNAENKVMLVFNVPVVIAETVQEYLVRYSLFADEPTIIPGTKYAQYTIQVETDRLEIPLAKVRYDLVKMGARSLDTIPLLSSIPDINLLKG